MILDTNFSMELYDSPVWLDMLSLTCCATTVTVACPFSAEELLYDKNVSIKANMQLHACT